MGARRLAIAIVVLLVLLGVLAYLLLRGPDRQPPLPGEPSPTEPSPTEPAPGQPTEAEAAALIAAGDIARCGDDGDPEEGAQRTGELIEQLDGIVAPLGDLAYNDGTADEFEDCYDPAWGSFRERTRPAIGDHDDNTEDGEPFFDYFSEFFSEVEVPQPEAYYSYELGDWHVFVLNSNCDDAGGCDADDPQAEWLREELEDIETDNILAYWHRPLFSSGDHGPFEHVEDFYEILDEAGADIILSGHDHDYQRWAPQHADGTMDPEAPRQFVVGTGGASLRPFEGDAPDGVEYRQAEEHGVLRLELEPCGYRWEFISVDSEVLDDGRQDDTC